MKPDFYYQCNQCKRQVDAHFDNPLAGVKAVESSKANEFVFYCNSCFATYKSKNK